MMAIYPMFCKSEFTVQGSDFSAALMTKQHNLAQPSL